MNEVTISLTTSIGTIAALATAINAACQVRSIAASVAVTNYHNESVVGDQEVHPTETKTNGTDNAAYAEKSDSSVASEEVAAEKGGVKATNLDARATDAETKAAAVDTSAVKTGAGDLETGVQVMKVN